MSAITEYRSKSGTSPLRADTAARSVSVLQMSVWFKRLEQCPSHDTWPAPVCTNIGEQTMNPQLQVLVQSNLQRGDRRKNS